MNHFRVSYELQQLQLKENEVKRIIEIRGAEGGADSRLFAKDLAAAYVKACGKLG